jgi:hypothetical protein
MAVALQALRTPGFMELQGLSPHPGLEFNLPSARGLVFQFLLCRVLVLSSWSRLSVGASSVCAPPRLA